MFGLGMPEILMILAIALIVIGPKKLPDLAKTLGRAMGEFKRSAQDFKRSIDVETTVKDLKDIADPKVDLEGIIKGTDTESDSKTDPEDETGAGETPDEPSDDMSGTENTDKDIPDTDGEYTPKENDSDKQDNTSDKNKNG